MKFYFDVTETFIKTIAIEADNLEQAQRRVDGAWRRNEFEIEHEYPDGIEFKDATTEVEEFFQTGDCAEEELETFNCNDVVYDEETDSYVCPVCGEDAADRWQIKDLEFPLPKYCHECGAKLHY
jgi:predicted RNA-binding Zn-ribbon protein involved in translation (DUF1610 family)